MAAPLPGGEEGRRRGAGRGAEGAAGSDLAEVSGAEGELGEDAEAGGVPDGHEVRRRELAAARTAALQLPHAVEEEEQERALKQGDGVNTGGTETGRRGDQRGH